LSRLQFLSARFAVTERKKAAIFCKMAVLWLPHKLELGEHLQSTIYNLQSAKLGGLSPADMRSLFHRYCPRFQARAAVSVIPASLITGVSLHSPTL
jgi:hypothetical protein